MSERQGSDGDRDDCKTLKHFMLLAWDEFTRGLREGPPWFSGQAAPGASILGVLTQRTSIASLIINCCTDRRDGA